MLVLLFAQAVYLHVNREKIHKLSTQAASYLKWCYIVGLASPILDWIFIFFLIHRVREDDDRRGGSNPNFLNTEDNEGIEDYDQVAVEQHLGEKNPILYEDLRNDYYSRPANNRSSSPLPSN